VLVLATGAARADETDEFVKAEMRRQNIPGLSLAVVKGGELVKGAGYGLANAKLSLPATPATVYKIASVSKQFIAAGVMLLAQEGRLRLEDPIDRYVEGTPAAWKAITIRHLLTHTSGLVREAPGFDPFKVQSDSDVIRSAYPLPLRFAPGEKWEYGNVGYFTLAEVIRRTSGLPWTEYLAAKVFAPSGMTMTRPTNTNESMPKRAVGNSANEERREAADSRAMRPRGAFLSTVLDLAKWDAVLYTEKVLSESSRRQMWTPVELNDGTAHPYGFGWAISSLNGRRQVHHTGGMPGFRSGFARFVDDRLTVIVLMNLDDVDINSVVQGIAKLHLAAPKP
jgi:CubicO group peptidase (beta-lactamase class C family)